MALVILQNLTKLYGEPTNLERVVVDKESFAIKLQIDKTIHLLLKKYRKT